MLAWFQKITVKAGYKVYDGKREGEVVSSFFLVKGEQIPW